MKEKEILEAKAKIEEGIRLINEGEKEARKLGVKVNVSRRGEISGTFFGGKKFYLSYFYI